MNTNSTKHLSRRRVNHSLLAAREGTSSASMEQSVQNLYETTRDAWLPCFNAEKASSSGDATN